MQQYKSFKGTPREFIAANVQINGKEINQPALSLMAQYGVAKIVEATIGVHYGYATLNSVKEIK